MDPNQFNILMNALGQIYGAIRNPHGAAAEMAPPAPLAAAAQPSLTVSPAAGQHGMVIFFTSGTGQLGGSVTVQQPNGQTGSRGIEANASSGSCAVAAWQAAISAGLQARLEGGDGVRMFGVGFSVTVVGATIVKSDF